MVNHDFRKSKTPRCPEGYILRDSYTTKNGTYVPARCIKARSLSGEKAKIRVRRQIEVENKAARDALKMAEHMCNEEGCVIPTSCPKGQILRDAYVRKPYVREDGTKVKGRVVPPSCITNRGAKGKGERKIILDAHIGHGYEDVIDKTENQRHRALLRAFRDLEKTEGTQNAYGTLIHQLVARANLGIRTTPKISKVFREDADWLSAKLEDWKKNQQNDKKEKKPHTK